MMLTILLWLLSLAPIHIHAQIQHKGFFRLFSPENMNDSAYGKVRLGVGKYTVIIQTIVANGENVKGLSIRMNKGFPFKLAPSQTGSVLHYVGTQLGLVLKPGDEAEISFILSELKSAGNRQLYLAGEAVE